MSFSVLLSSNFYSSDHYLVITSYPLRKLTPSRHLPSGSRRENGAVPDGSDPVGRGCPEGRPNHPAGRGAAPSGHRARRRGVPETAGRKPAIQGLDNDPHRGYASGVMIHCFTFTRTYAGNILLFLALRCLQTVVFRGSQTVCKSIQPARCSSLCSVNVAAK